MFHYLWEGLLELPFTLKKWVTGWLSGGPHFIVGPKSNPYLFRWYILPRNPLCCIYLHKFLRDDDDRALHDHPWPSMSILLRGRYLEQMEASDLSSELRLVKLMRSWRWFWLGLSLPSIIFRWATHKHRIELIDGKPAWTLFVTGPRVREWGFHCPKGWVHWREFVRMDSAGEVGKGCD